MNAKRLLFAVVVLAVMPTLIAALALRQTLLNEGEAMSAPELAIPRAAMPPGRGPMSADKAPLEVDQTRKELAIPRPVGPPDGAPIFGDKVPLEVARARTRYTIPIPADTATAAELTEVWVSPEADSPGYQQVYLIYSNGLEMSIGGRTAYPMDFTSLTYPPFQAITVKGAPRRANDPFVTQTKYRGEVKGRGTVSWWVNGVWISIRHRELSMDQLLRVAESMPAPVWPSKQN